MIPLRRRVRRTQTPFFQRSGRISHDTTVERPAIPELEFMKEFLSAPE